MRQTRPPNWGGFLLILQPKARLDRHASEDLAGLGGKEARRPDLGGAGDPGA